MKIDKLNLKYDHIGNDFEDCKNKINEIIDLLNFNLKISILGSDIDSILENCNKKMKIEKLIDDGAIPASSQPKEVDFFTLNNAKVSYSCLRKINELIDAFNDTNRIVEELLIPAFMDKKNIYSDADNKKEIIDELNKLKNYILSQEALKFVPKNYSEGAFNIEEKLQEHITVLNGYMKMCEECKKIPAVLCKTCKKEEVNPPDSHKPKTITTMVDLKNLIIEYEFIIANIIRYNMDQDTILKMLNTKKTLYEKRVLEESEIKKEPEIFPCPFCGKLPEIFFIASEYCFLIKCRNDDCLVRGASTIGKKTEKEAIDAWNKRA